MDQLSLTCWHSTTEQAGLIRRNLVVEPHNMGYVHNRVFHKAWNKQEMVHNLPFHIPEPAASIPWHTLVELAPKFCAKVALSRRAIPAFLAARKKHWNHQISFFHFFHMLSHTLNNTSHAPTQKLSVKSAHSRA